MTTASVRGRLYEFNPGVVSDMQQNGEPVETAWRLALSRRPPAVGADRAARRPQRLRTFLAEHGEGVHHVGVAVPSYDDAVATVEAKGRKIVLGGEYNGVKFSYLPTGEDLGVITEIFSAAPGEDQQPDAVYP